MSEEIVSGQSTMYPATTTRPLYICGGRAAERFEAAARVDTDWEEGDHGLMVVPAGTRGALYRKKGLVMFKPSDVRTAIPTACLSQSVTIEPYEAGEEECAAVSLDSLVLEMAVPDCFDLVGREMGKYRCAVCRSEEVEHAVWQSLNSEAIGPAFGDWCSDENSWCRACDSNVRVLAPWEDDENDDGIIWN